MVTGLFRMACARLSHLLRLGGLCRARVCPCHVSACSKIRGFAEPAIYGYLVSTSILLLPVEGPAPYGSRTPRFGQCKVRVGSQVASSHGWGCTRRSAAARGRASAGLSSLSDSTYGESARGGATNTSSGLRAAFPPGSHWLTCSVDLQKSRRLLHPLRPATATSW